MDVNETIYQAEASNVNIAPNDEEITGSSNRKTNPQVNKQMVASSSKVTGKSSETIGDVLTQSKAHNIEEENTQQLETISNLQEEQHPEVINDKNIANLDGEEYQNEQHIDNAGIDRNLALVRRVSTPCAGDNSGEQAEVSNEDSVAMDHENGDVPGAEVIVLEGLSAAEFCARCNSYSRGASANEDEDGRLLEFEWSEEEADPYDG